MIFMNNVSSFRKEILSNRECCSLPNILKTSLNNMFIFICKLVRTSSQKEYYQIIFIQVYSVLIN